MRNYNSEIIHETVVRDIVNILTNLNFEPEDYVRNVLGKYSYSSASKATSNLTLVFPVIAEESVSVDGARMVTKAIERKVAAMMQMLFSAINITNARDAIDYIKTIHHNINFDDRSSVSDYIDLMDHIAQESGIDAEIVDPKKYKAVLEDMKNLNFYLEEGPANPPIGRFVIDKNNDKVIMEFEDGCDSNKDVAAFYKNQQISSDVKKANELLPTLMTIRFHKMVDGVPIASSAVIGIKAKLQYVSRQDMMNRIVIKNKDRNGLFNFLRATTREISFWKDFLFAIDRAKIDALSTSSRGNSDPIWKLLEHRAIKSRLKRSLGLNNEYNAITTLIVSNETADTLSREDGVNVLRPKIIKGIMDAYNIMGFVVIDEVAEKVNFLFDDGSDRYEIVSYSHLEREEKSDFKKIVNLLAGAR